MAKEAKAGENLDIVIWDYKTAGAETQEYRSTSNVDFKIVENKIATEATFFTESWLEYNHQTNKNDISKSKQNPATTFTLNNITDEWLKSVNNIYIDGELISESRYLTSPVSHFATNYEINKKGLTIDDSLFKPNLNKHSIKIDAGAMGIVNGEFSSTLIADNNFTDVPQGAWFKGAVDFVVEKGFYNGTGKNLFSPNEPMTRAMFVTVISRVADIGDYSAKANFSDIITNSWYGPSVAWAVDNKIAQGVGNNKFAPNQSISREEMAVMLYKYNKLKGSEIAKQKDASKVDMSSVSTWAKEAMLWAYQTGLIQGDNNNNLQPQAKATRAEVAAILQRYLQTK